VCRKPPKKWAFLRAPRSRRCIRSPATITRSAFSGVNAWRSPTPPRLRAAPGAPRTRRGPAGRLLQAWRRLAERDPLDKAIRLVLRPKDWMVDLTNALDLPLDAALEDVGDAAKTLAVGEGSAIAAAAQVAAVSLQKRPDAETLALWLADAVLAHRLKWPAPVPLIAGQIRRSDLRAARRDHEGDRAWEATWMLAYARAAAADLYAELVRRAHQLLAAAPKLRGRDAVRRVEIMLTEDAQAATAGAAATDRSSRRLFERLVAIGAARELTGRPTFRLYGL
jgi:Protein of unknown function (DUF1403)